MPCPLTLADALITARAFPQNQLEVMLVGMAPCPDEEDSSGNADGMGVPAQWWDVLIRTPDFADADGFDLISVAEHLTTESDALTIAAALASMLLGSPDAYEAL